MVDFNITSKEFKIIKNETFHIRENDSIDKHVVGENNPSPSAEMMALYVFLFLIVEILGNYLLLSMIIYEKYGMDPQKRTVTNQLLSSICGSFLIQNFVAVPILMFERIYPPFLITQCKEIFTLLGLLRVKKEFTYTLQVPVYPLLIINHSWILTIHKFRNLLKKLLKKNLVFKNWVKSIQTAGYNGLRTVYKSSKAKWSYRRQQVKHSRHNFSLYSKETITNHQKMGLLSLSSLAICIKKAEFSGFKV